MKRKIYIEIITALLIVIFIYAGLSKLLDYSIFKFQLEESPLLSSWAGIIAGALPVTELLLGILLIVPAARLLGYYLSFLLLIIFTVYLVYMLTFYDHLPCSCGGFVSFMSWKQHVAFNSGFILLTLTAIILDKRQNRQTSFPGFA